MDETHASEIQRMDVYQLMQLAEVEKTVAGWRRSLLDEQFLLPLRRPPVQAPRRAG